MEEKKKKKLKQDQLSAFSIAETDLRDNMLRNFIRMCCIGANLKMSPRQIFASIAAASLLDGQTTPLFGYNLRSEASITQMQVFCGYVLRANLMNHIKTARVISLFSDAESARHDKLLLFGVHVPINGYACPLHLSVALGGSSVTGETLFDSLKHGITGDNILSGAAFSLLDLSDDFNQNDTKASLEKVRKLNNIMPIGMEWDAFVPKISNSLTDGDSKYRLKMLRLIRTGQMRLTNSSSSALGTWCLGHCFSLAGDDLRNYSSIVDSSIKLIISTRSFLGASSARTAKLKVVCSRIGIKYVTIPDSFEDRFQSWLGIALESFVRILPALYVMFNELDNSQPDLPRNPIGRHITDNFALVEFILSWSSIMKKESQLDKELQE